jgi:hypothetical protein
MFAKLEEVQSKCEKLKYDLKKSSEREKMVAI